MAVDVAVGVEAAAVDVILCAYRIKRAGEIHLLSQTQGLNE